LPPHCSTLHRNIKIICRNGIPITNKSPNPIMEVISFNIWNALMGKRTVLFAGLETRFYLQPPLTVITFTFRQRHFQIRLISRKMTILNVVEIHSAFRCTNFETGSSDMNPAHTLHSLPYIPIISIRYVTPTTALQVGRSQVRFPIRSFRCFTYSSLPAALWPWGWLSLQQKSVPRIFPGG
jgi:hypothetical protein